MNKKKNEEIKGFLKWFEREIGSEIDSLANKTAVTDAWLKYLLNRMRIDRKVDQSCLNDRERSSNGISSNTSYVKTNTPC